MGSLIPAALRASVKGGVVVSGGIHMSDIPSFPYSILWLKRSLGTKVEIKTRAGRGHITVHFYSDEELDRLIDLFS